jgi:hypothetical protein
MATNAEIYQQSVNTLVDQALQIPGAREAAIQKAREIFIDEYGPAFAVASVALLGLAFAAGRASK